MHPLSSQQRELAEEAASLAAPIAQRWEKLHPRYADQIRSSAMLGAVVAAESFEPEQDGATWRRWVTLKVKGAIVDCLRADSRHSFCSASQAELEEIEDHRASGALEDATERAIRLLRLLPSRHKDLCDLVYRHGMDPTAASRELGFSQSYGCRLHREALALMRGMAGN